MWCCPLESGQLPSIYTTQDRTLSFQEPSIDSCFPGRRRWPIPCAAYIHCSYYAWLFFFHWGGWPLYHSPSIEVGEQLARVRYLSTMWILNSRGQSWQQGPYHEAISPTIQFLSSRWRTNVGYSHKHPNIHIAAIKWVYGLCTSKHLMLTICPGILSCKSVHRDRKQRPCLSSYC